MSESFPIRLSVWSDYVCPFCYLELPVLDRLQAEFDGRIEVDWLAFELRPDPAPTLDPNGEYLHRVWNESVYPMAAERGLMLRLPPVQPHSRRALEAAEFARRKGRFDPMHRALFRAFFEHGRDLADITVLLDIGRSVDLDQDELRDALATGLCAAKVAADQQIAREIGVSAVPALVLSAGEKGYLVNGAQPYEALRGVLEQALKLEALAS
jgi:predicted DsbA family dithiol-disulfide isomerase